VVIAHDALAQLARIAAPTQITFRRHDIVTSTRFADAMKNGIKGSELVVFETCAHAPIYESVPSPEPIADCASIANGGMDPAGHIRLGQALAPLRDEGVLSSAAG
jgi:hypothetical protein